MGKAEAVFAGFSKQLRGSSIGGTKTFSQSITFPVTELVVDYCVICVAPVTLVIKSTQNNEQEIICNLVTDGKGHTDIITLPKEGVYDIYIAKEDCVLIQYNVTIHN